MENSYNTHPDPRELRAANDDSYLPPELKASRQRAYSGSDPREIRAARDDSWRLPPFIPRN